MEISSQEFVSRGLSTAVTAGFRKPQSGSPQMLQHLLHAMDDDLESDNLFTSAKVEEPAPQAATCGSSREDPGTDRASELLRELELELEVT